MSIDGDWCPECEKKGIKSKLHLFQIDLEEALTMCKNESCIYPLASTPVSSLLVNHKIMEPNTKKNGKKLKNAPSRRSKNGREYFPGYSLASTVEHTGTNNACTASNVEISSQGFAETSTSNSAEVVSTLQTREMNEVPTLNNSDLDVDLERLLDSMCTFQNEVTSAVDSDIRPDASFDDGSHMEELSFETMLTSVFEATNGDGVCHDESTRPLKNQELNSVDPVVSLLDVTTIGYSCRSERNDSTDVSPTSPVCDDGTSLVSRCSSDDSSVVVKTRSLVPSSHQSEKLDAEKMSFETINTETNSSSLLGDLSHIRPNSSAVLEACEQDSVDSTSRMLVTEESNDVPCQRNGNVRDGSGASSSPSVVMEVDNRSQLGSSHDLHSVLLPTLQANCSTCPPQQSSKYPSHNSKGSAENKQISLQIVVKKHVDSSSANAGPKYDVLLQPHNTPEVPRKSPVVKCSSLQQDDKRQTQNVQNLPRTYAHNMRPAQNVYFWNNKSQLEQKTIAASPERKSTLLNVGSTTKRPLDSSSASKMKLPCEVRKRTRSADTCADHGKRHCSNSDPNPLSLLNFLRPQKNPQNSFKRDNQLKVPTSHSVPLNVGRHKGTPLPVVPSCTAYHQVTSWLNHRDKQKNFRRGFEGYKSVKCHDEETVSEDSGIFSPDSVHSSDSSTTSNGAGQRVT